MFLTFILQSSSGGLGLIFPLLMLAVFYFFFMRPQMKKQKEQGAFANELKKGDEVVTASGIIGQINKIEGNIVTSELDSKTFIRMFASSISKEMTDQYNKPKTTA